MQTSDLELLPAEVVGATVERRNRLRSLFASASIDAILIDYPTDIRHLPGFIGDDSLLLVDGERATIISDPRYDEYLEPWRGVDGVDVVMGVRHRLADALRAVWGERPGRLGVQAERVTVARYETLRDALGGVETVPTRDIVTWLRMRKDEVEVAAIERSVALQEAAIAAALTAVRPGMTELAFAAHVEFEMKSRGAERSSFDPIVATGANSSVIHHSTSRAAIEPGVLLVDWGAQLDGYCSDMTRTFSLGPFPAPIAEIYGIVLEAHLAAIDACAPGRTCAEIDSVARDIITKAGYGEHFGHGLGHGLGLEVHESPYFNDLDQTRLEPGMVMTVEPGIYLPGVGGVRIEDDVLVTADGARTLCHRAKDLDSAVIGTGA